MSNATDAYGNPLSGNNDRDPNNTILSAAPKSGIVTKDGIVGPIIGSGAIKSAEEIQKEKDKSGIMLSKRRGRAETILTGSKGLMDEDEIINRKRLLV